MDSCNLTQHVQSPTHVQGHILHVLITWQDTKLINIKPEVKETYIADFKSGSLLDHSAILADIEFSTTESCNKIISFLFY